MITIDNIETDIIDHTSIETDINNFNTFSNIENCLNKIICGKCEDIMKHIPDNSVDLIVTSPPYNLKNSTGNGMKCGKGGKWSNAALINGYEDYDDCLPYD